MRVRALVLLAMLAAVVAAPLAMRRDGATAEPGEGVDRLIVVTPHNDSIRKEFGEAFARHWREKTGRGLYVDWRAPGGTGEIRRLVNGAFEAAADLGRVGCGFDVFFGGGPRDFQLQAELGHLAPLEVFERHPEWFGEGRIPAMFSGEPYYDPQRRWVGNCVSQFGIVYNRDVIERLGLAPPQHWDALGDFSYFGRLALADPTKSGSVTKAFEMLVQEQMQRVIRERGDSPEARAQGWRRGMALLIRLGANARYFTDSASKIPHDVASGNAAAGTCIDFYGRTFEEAVRREDGDSRVKWLAPAGGTSLSVDPVAVFRGAPNAEVAQEFVVFLLSREGQLLWNLKPGAPGGPRERALRRLPVRRDLYEPEYLRDFSDPGALPYERTGRFVYRPELTEPAFSALRLIFRAMCMDPHEELQEAWERSGGEARFDLEPVAYERVMGEIVPLLERGDPLEQSRLFTDLSREFRDRYRRLAKGEGVAR